MTGQASSKPAGKGGGLTARPQGVRPPTPLTVSAIVEGAIALIDDEGAEAFSIRNLSRALGVYPTAVYHHVGDRRQLLGLVGAAWMDAVIPEPDLASPFRWLRSLGFAYRDAAQRHPNVARLIAGEIVNDTAGFWLPENIVSHLSAAGLPDEELAPMYNTIVGTVVGFVDLELADLRPGSDEARQRARDDVQAIDPQRYPTLHRHIDSFANQAFSLRWQSGDEAPLDESYAYLVETLVASVRDRARAAKRRR